MALLETTIQAAGGPLGFTVGYVGTRYASTAVGYALRPVAKALIRGALMVSGGFGPTVRPIHHRAPSAKAHAATAAKASGRARRQGGKRPARAAVTTHRRRTARRA
jgi:hypothetical protein